MTWDHVSASQINTFRDCPRKWWLQKIKKLSTPSSSAAEMGRRIHAVLEDYLTKGQMPDNSTEGLIAQRGLEYLPLPGTSAVELPIHQKLPIKDAPVDVLGYVDCLYLPRKEGELPIILDHKTTGSKKYTKNELEMETDVQLHVYARALFANSEYDEAILRLVYYGTRAPFAFPVEITVKREQNEEQWTKILATINEMKQTAEQEEQEVPQNWSSCSKYGGCPFQAQCMLRPQKEEEKDVSNKLAQKLGLEKRASTVNGTPKTGAKMLLVGCTPLKGGSECKMFAEVYAPLYKQVEDKLRVNHVSLAEYGKGWSEFAALCKSVGWPPETNMLYIDPLDKAWEHIGGILADQADVVIRRL